MLCIEQTKTIGELHEQAQLCIEQKQTIDGLNAQLKYAKQSELAEQRLAQQRGIELAEITAEMAEMKAFKENDLQEQLNKLVRTNSHLQSGYQKVKQQYDQKQLQCTRLQSQLKVYEQEQIEFDQLQGEIQKLKAQDLDTTQKVQALKVMNDEYEQKLQDVKDEMRELTLQNQELELEIMRLKDDETLQATELAIELMRSELKKKETEIVKLGVSLREAVKTKKEAEDALRQFKDSKPQPIASVLHGDHELKQRLQSEAEE